MKVTSWSTGDFQCIHCQTWLDDDGTLYDHYQPNSHSGTATVNCPACKKQITVGWHTALQYTVHAPKPQPEKSP